MTCYMDRTFCSERGCATECYRRFYGTAHEADAKRVGLAVSMLDLRRREYCKGYTETRKAVDKRRSKRV